MLTNTALLKSQYLLRYTTVPLVLTVSFKRNFDASCLNVFMAPVVNYISTSWIKNALCSEWASQVAQMVKSQPATQETRVLSLVPGRSPGELSGHPRQCSWASLVAQLVKKICLQCGRPGFDPWVGNIPWRRERLPAPYSDQENSMDCIVHGVTNGWTWLSDFHFQSRVCGRNGFAGYKVRISF